MINCYSVLVGFCNADLICYSVETGVILCYLIFGY